MPSHRAGFELGLIMPSHRAVFRLQRRELMVLRKHTVDLDSLHIEDIFGVPGKLGLGLGKNFKCPI